MTYDRRKEAANAQQMKELAAHFLQIQGYSREQVRAWTTDMAKALTKAIAGSRDVSEILHFIGIEEEEDERRIR